MDTCFMPNVVLAPNSDLPFLPLQNSWFTSEPQVNCKTTFTFRRVLHDEPQGKKKYCINTVKWHYWWLFSVKISFINLDWDNKLIHINSLRLLIFWNSLFPISDRTIVHAHRYVSHFTNWLLPTPIHVSYTGCPQPSEWVPWVGNWAQ